MKAPEACCVATNTTCCPGLFSGNDLEISKLVKKYQGDQLLEQLLEATKAKGAPDNVTILIAEVIEGKDDGQVILIGAADELN